MSTQVHPAVSAVIQEPVSSFNNAELASLYHGQGEYQAAAKYAKMAVQLDPGNGNAWATLGASYVSLGEFEIGRGAIDEALRLNPEHPGARWNRFWCNLAVGNYLQAWEDQEFRFVTEQARLRCYGKEWNGENLEGKTVFVWAEQGLGDQIMFARWLSVLKQLAGATVVLEVNPLLVRLMDGLADEVRAVQYTRYTPFEYDYQVALQSLPLKLFRHFGYDEIPQERLFNFDHGQTEKVGLCLVGNSAHKNDKNRTPKPEDCEPLQGKAEFVWFGGGDPYWGLEAWNGGDLFATAEQISKTKRVLTVDTAVAHLCGAMGHPVTCVIPLNGEGRWGISGSTNAWYPSMQIIRPGEFEGGFREVFERWNLDQDQ